MIKFLKRINRKEQFDPGPLSILINSNYFIKKGITRGIKNNAHFMKGRLLDFGCGNKPYKHYLKVDAYIGIDIQKIGHDHSQEQIEIFYDGKTIPLESASFDSVFSSEVFEHVFNLNDILKEINRVLKTGGNLLITLPFVWYEHETPHDYARYTSFGIKYILEQNGFEIVTIEKSSNFTETVFQIIAAWLYHSVFPKNNAIRAILTVLFIFPVNITGILLSHIFKKSQDLYLNNVVVAKKITEVNEGTIY